MAGREIATYKSVATAAAPATPYTFTLTAGTDYPLGARALRLALEIVPVSVTTPAGPWNYAITDGTRTLESFALDQSNNGYVVFDLPLLGTSPYGTASVVVTRSNVGPNVPASYILHLKGIRG
jgi:hypothetical protein